MTSTETGRPENVRLVPGAMQHWSDLDRQVVGASTAVRALVREVVSGAGRVAIVGAAPLDLITGLADETPSLTVITRSIPDAVTVGELLQDVTGVQVVCGSAAQVEDTFDAVVVLADLAAVQSLEAEPVTWRAAYDDVRTLVADGGRLLLGIENELGLQRMTALRSRYTTDTDADWSVTATFDASRPRSLEAVRELCAADDAARVEAAFPDWQQPTVLASVDPAPAGALRQVLEAVVLASPSYRQLGADPTRVTRAAVLAGRLLDFASGWYVVTGLPRAGTATVTESGGQGAVVSYTQDGPGAVRRVGQDGTERVVDVPQDARLVSEDLLDAAAGGDLTALRVAVRDFADGVRSRADGGVLPAEVADVRPDNVLRTADDLVVIAPAHTSAPVEDALITGLADLVATLRARGARHPWPAAIDDATMLGNLVAMAGIDPQAATGRTVPTTGQDTPLPAYDIPGLLAVVERLTHANTALASKAAWFEQRLSVREREMRARAEQHRRQLADASRGQEILRSRAEDIRRSLTYRAGNVILGPVRNLRSRTRDKL
ncbi:hypothetical protein [Flexivirga meconopsidis]|uniref:hypothetical protein n=1 Tax=Flexivirga meconopsidis TaxID=2977121 RepID=UPI002240C4BE|nr:hypothetical protein [Flexivirga meconopsidis]